MKKLNRLISIAICLSLIGGIAFAQPPAEPGCNPQVRSLESAQQSVTKVQFHMDNLQFTEVQTSNGMAQAPTFSEIVRDILLTPVANLTISAEGNTVTLKWDAPDFGDSEAPTNYTYTVSRNMTIVAEGLTATTFSESNLPADLYIYCVQVIYPESESIIKCVDIRILNHVTGLTATQDGMDVVLRWMAPGEEDETVLLEEGFESGIPAAWTTIDADGDGNDWTTTPPPGGNSFAGHNGGATASSASYINNVGTQTPDNYLVTPSLNLTNGGTLTFWVCAQDAGYAAEHYAVYASTGGNAATDFVNPLMEETLTAKSEVLYPEAVRGSRTQGTWYQKTVQLPAGTKYVAFRHFDCTDQFWLNVDDVKISEDGGGGSNNPLDYTYTVYRDGSKIKEDLTATTYTDAGMASSNYEYCVEVVSPSGVSPKVCINYNDLNDVVAAKPYTITVVDKTITVTCEGEAMIYDMMGRRLAAGCNTVVYTAQDGFYAAMIVVDGKSYVEKLAIN